MCVGGRLELIDSYHRETEIIENHIKKNYAPGQVLQILEAGCGANWRLKLDGVKYVLTGVDLDKAALELRKRNQNDLDEIIEGDLRSVHLQENHYDIIYNSFVLEHVKGAEDVMRNFVSWLKPGGLIIILIPDPHTVYGAITRATPHWFHVLYYRSLGYKNAGKPGFFPYPVHYDTIVSRRGMRDFCSKNDIKVLVECGDGFFRPGSGAVQSLIHYFKKMVSVLSFGYLSSRHTWLLYILQK